MLLFAVFWVAVIFSFSPEKRRILSMPSCVTAIHYEPMLFPVEVMIDINPVNTSFHFQAIDLP